ncbi:MAG: zinc-ribbon domain-containing protein [Methanobrevibacter sp.]|nr:zinc-ribbon domain-containing protein [Methanobrevibacter sp.]
MKQCNECGAENPDSAKFCYNCGCRHFSTQTNSNGIICPKCGEENRKDSKFCHSCGASLKTYSFSSSDDGSSSFRSSSTNNNSDSSSINKDNSTAGSTNSSANKNDSSSSRKVSSASISTNPSPIKAKKNLINKRLCCCYVPVVLLVAFLIFAFLLQAYPESFSTNYDDEFNSLDSNYDGMLSFSEARKIDSNIPNKVLKVYFNEADTNHNEYLIGHEFDFFWYDVEDYYDNYTSTDYSSSNSHKYSSSSSSGSSGSTSSSSSSSSKSYSSDSNYLLTCPYCGSEAIYESGNYYKCAECGNTIYNPDDLELNYDEGYIDLLLPLSLKGGVMNG